MINVSIEQFSQLDPEGYYVNISSTMIETARQVSQGRRTAWGQNNAFLQRLCWDIMQPWLRENGEDLAVNQTEISAWYLRHDPDLWELTNGLGCENNQYKLVIIPSLDFDTDEFVVPQEWVDIQDFVADYYVAVQVNLEDNYAYFWGFASHAMVKHQGVYDSQARVYRLAHQQMITDGEIIWLMQGLGHTERAPIAPVVPPTSTPLDTLLSTIPPAIAPVLRRQMPVDLWGAILRNPGDRQRLIDWLPDRLTVTEVSNAEPEQATVGQTLASSLVQLSQWLSGEMESLSTGWRELEQLINPGWQWAAVRSASSPQSSWQSKGTLVELDGLSQPLVLGVAFREATPSTYEIWIELYPSPQQQILPRGLRLEILAADNTVVMAVESEATTPYLRLNLAADSQDQFTVLLQYIPSAARFQQTFMV
ncbi:MAG: DUF1822 family protein [Synechocystis sp.]|nr:DUF1822 family protein [Synechocystis sp.]